MVQEPNKKKEDTINNVLHPDIINSLGSIINSTFEQWKEIETNKAKNIYKFSIFNKIILNLVVCVFVCILTYLLVIGRISETIFSTLIGSIIGYTIGGGYNKSAKGN